MTWHLKDRELERVLEKYSDGNFVKALNFAIERDWIDAENVVTVEFKRKFLSIGYTNDLSFRTDELEEVPEYNPHKWNEYPKVTPPDNVLMLVEFKDGSLGKAFFKKGIWKDIYNVMYSYKPVRYRPWSED